MDYLAKVINPAGKNLPELRNLSPITTVRVPEVPAFPQEREKELLACVWKSVAINKQTLTHLEKARRSLGFEIPYRRQLQPTGQTGALQPER